MRPSAEKRFTALPWCDIIGLVGWFPPAWSRLVAAGAKGYNPCIEAVTCCRSLAFPKRPSWRWRRRFYARLSGQLMRVSNRLRRTQRPARELSDFRIPPMRWRLRPPPRRMRRSTLPPGTGIIPASWSCRRSSPQSTSNCRCSPLRRLRSLPCALRRILRRPGSKAESRRTAAPPSAASPAGVCPQTHRVLLAFRQARLIGTYLCG